MKAPITADLIVCRIVSDIKLRKGLRQEWESIDPRVQTEIRKEWKLIIAEEIAKELLQ